MAEERGFRFSKAKGPWLAARGRLPASLESTTLDANSTNELKLMRCLTVSLRLFYSPGSPPSLLGMESLDVAEISINRRTRYGIAMICWNSYFSTSGEFRDWQPQA